MKKRTLIFISYTSLCSNATQHGHYVNVSVINDIFFVNDDSRRPSAVNAIYVEKNAVLIAKQKI